MPKSSKGARFERWFCKELSLWWSMGTNDAIFWRTPSSGGRATTRGKQDKKTANHYGDIMAVDPAGLPFTELLTVELKNGYSRFSFADLFDTSPGTVPLYRKWIEGAEKVRNQAGAYGWLIVVKRDRREPIAIMTEQTWKVCSAGSTVCPSATLNLASLKFPPIKVVLLESMLAKFNPANTVWARDRYRINGNGGKR